MFMRVLQHHPNCPFSYLWGIPRCSCHDSILSNFGVSGNPGAVHNGIGLLTGVEANIARDGSIDVPKELLKRLDFVIVAVHSHFRLSRDEMTERLIKAVETEGVRLLAHPTGRKIGERPAYEADWEWVFEHAANAKTALEINANPIRLDLHAEHVRQAVDVGAKLAIGTDAHVPEHFDFAEFGVLTARRGWAQGKDVLNAFPVDGLLEWLA